MRRLHTVKVNQSGGMETQHKGTGENITAKCLQVNDSGEKDMVVYALASLLNGVGSEKTIAFLSDMDTKGIKLIDVLHTLEKQCDDKTRQVLQLPKSSEINAIDRVRGYLWSKHGVKEGDNRLRKMSGENCILLNDLIKAGKAAGGVEEENLTLPKRSNEDGSLRLPPMKEIIEGKASTPRAEKGEREVLGLPKMDYTKGGKK